MASTKLLAVLLYCCLETALSFQVTQMQYHFWFKDKIRENWIVDRFEDSHMITCVQKCKNSDQCGGLALGPLKEDPEDHGRTCLLLANVDETECNGNDDCSREEFQVYLKEKSLTTTTEPQSTTTSAPTTTTETTTELETTATSTTTTTTKASNTTTTTTEESTTTKTSKGPTTASTTVTEASTTTTKAPTSTTKPSTTTTTETPTTTAKPPTTTTTPEPTTTTTKAPTTTTTKPPSTVTTEAPTTTTEASTTTTTTKAPTTTTTTTTITTDKLTTTQEPTTTTKVPTTTTTTTTTEKPTTTTEKPTTTTEKPTTTTQAPTTTTEKETTTAITTSTTEEPVGDCNVPTAQKVCGEPKTQYLSYGLISDGPLFSDANLKIQCKKFMNNIFKSTSSKQAYRPFSGLFTCAENEAMTGIEICFQVDLIYLAPYCTELEPGYKLVTDNIKEVKNTPEKPGEVTCPDEMVQLTLKLEEDSDGRVAVFIRCAKLEQA